MTNQMVRFLKSLALPLTIATLQLSTPARAAEFSGDILSYSELMRLSPTKRAEYIDGIRTILIDLSKQKNGRLSDRDSARRSALLQLINQFATPVVAATDASATDLCSASSACKVALLACREQRKPLTWKKDAYVCEGEKIALNMILPNPQEWTKVFLKSLPDPKLDPANAMTLQTDDKIAQSVLYGNGKLQKKESAAPASPPESVIGNTEAVRARLRAQLMMQLKTDAEKTCKPKELTCAGSSEDRSKAFYAAPGQVDCIFAGIISKLDGNKCTAVTEFSWSGGNLKCGAGQTMCNPLLFGAVSSTQAICVGRGMDATAQCSKLSSARDTGNDFREGMKRVCDETKPSGRFHCTECSVMHKRIFELHARVVGNPCEAADVMNSLSDGLKTRSDSKKVGR